MIGMMWVAALLAAPAAAQDVGPTGAAVAEAVESGFPAHDVDADGKLSRAEFANWMVQLKAKSDPSARPSSPATRKWVAGAFRAADKDRNAGVTKAELAGLLTRGRS